MNGLVECNKCVVHMFGHVSVYQETGISGCLALTEFSHVRNQNKMVSSGYGPVVIQDYKVIKEYD